MATSAQRIESEALSLSRDERVRLAIILLDSIEERQGMDPQLVERAWIAEANTRYLAYRNGDEP
jgi:hypothetical protein